MKAKIHFHSDCSFFAGCEKMLINFFSDEKLRKEYEISFSYRDSREYSEGLYKNFSPNFQTFPLNFTPILKNKTDASFLKRFFIFAFRLISLYPFFVIDVLILFFLLRRIRPTIVLLNNGGYPGARSVLAGSIAAKLIGTPKVFMVVNNLAVPYQGINRFSEFLIDKLVVKSVDTFITGSKVACNQLKKVLKLTESNVISLHNGIRIQKVVEANESVRKRLGVPKSFGGLVVGVVSLMEVRKGHLILIKAVEQLKAQNKKLSSEILFYFEGDGPLREELISEVESRNLSDSIRFQGHEERIFDFMNAIDVLILPSISNEDFPNVTLEAMSLGKLVIASNLAGTSEQIENQKNGLLFEPGNYSELAATIEFAINNRKKSKEISRRAMLAFSENFIAEKAVSRYLRLFNL